MRFYNCNQYGRYSRDCPDQAPTEGGAHINIRADNSVVDNNNKNDALDSGGKSNTMLYTMNLENYEPSYDGY